MGNLVNNAGAVLSNWWERGTGDPWGTLQNTWQGGSVPAGIWLTDISAQAWNDAESAQTKQNDALKESMGRAMDVFNNPPPMPKPPEPPEESGGSGDMTPFQYQPTIAPAPVASAPGKAATPTYTPRRTPTILSKPGGDVAAPGKGKKTLLGQ